MRALKWRYKLPIILAIILAVLAILWFVFLIRTVTVEGNTFFPEEAVAEEYQQHFWQKNVLTNFIMDHLGFTENPPYVRESELSYPSFGELHIKLYEKAILAGLCFSGHYIYFDKDGMVLKTTTEPLPDIPYFESDDVKDFTLYRTLQTGREELLSQMLNLANRLSYYKIDWERISFDIEGHASLFKDNVTVLLGRRTDYDEVLSILPDIMKSALGTGEKGTIDMSNYKVGAPIIFKKEK